MNQFRFTRADGTPSWSSIGGLPLLSPRESDMVRLIMADHSVKSAAGKLGISEKTAQRYMLTAKQKIGAKTKSELIRAALRTGMVDVDEWLSLALPYEPKFRHPTTPTSRPRNRHRY